MYHEVDKNILFGHVVRIDKYNVPETTETMN